VIFNQIHLENFRVFKGRHSIPLVNDATQNAPVILFGGLNGSGKTSILTAIRLVLLGKRALSPNPTQKAYDEYLCAQINHAAKQQSEDITSVGLTITRNESFSDVEYLVIRSWSTTSPEELTLVIDGVVQKHLSKEQVEGFLIDLIPPGVADLFFFDGERIAELAEDDTGQYLKQAINKLLGVDVLQRLEDDLDIYIQKLSRDSASTKDLSQINELEALKEESLRQSYYFRQQADQLSIQLREREIKKNQLEEKIAVRGGAWARSRDEQKNKVSALIKEEAELKSLILSQLAGLYPISLANNFFEGLSSELEQELNVKQKSGFLVELDSAVEKAAQLISRKSTKNFPDDIVQALIREIKLLPDYQDLPDVQIDLSSSETSRLMEHIQLAKVSRDDVNQQLESLAATSECLENLSVNLQRAPSEEELVELYEKLNTINESIFRTKQSYISALSNAKIHTEKALELAKKLEKIYSKRGLDGLEQKARERALAAKAVLQKFVTNRIQKSIRQLEVYFSEAFSRLSRKKRKGFRATIDVNTFNVILIDSDGGEINRKSISAGEKQIFAFAMLDALANLSGKSLPLVIDTPLGRLDSEHRDNLVDKYFPIASNQVIVLSTDTEIDKQFYLQLAPHMSISYHIEYIEEANSSEITTGYFWNASEQGVLNAS
jgi:DNA sulfur modification protein DndD